MDALERATRLAKIARQTPKAVVPPAAPVIRMVTNSEPSAYRELLGVVKALQERTIFLEAEIVRLEGVLRPLINDPFSAPMTGQLSIRDIVGAVAKHYRVWVRDIHSERRSLEFTVPRQVAIYLARKFTKQPYTAIGREIGDRDRSTVMHSCDIVERRRRDDPKLDYHVSQLEQFLRLRIGAVSPSPTPTASLDRAALPPTSPQEGARSPIQESPNA